LTGARGRRHGRLRRARRAADARPRIQHVLHSNATLGPLFVLLLAVAIIAFSIQRPVPLPANLSLVVQQVMVIGTLGSPRRWSS
jgi:hypothetical protein